MIISIADKQSWNEGTLHCRPIFIILRTPLQKGLPVSLEKLKCLPSPDYDKSFPYDKRIFENRCWEENGKWSTKMYHNVYIKQRQINVTVKWVFRQALVKVTIFLKRCVDNTSIVYWLTTLDVKISFWTKTLDKN